MRASDSLFTLRLSCRVSLSVDCYDRDPTRKLFGAVYEWQKFSLAAETFVGGMMAAPEGSARKSATKSTVAHRANIRPGASDEHVIDQTGKTTPDKGRSMTHACANDATAPTLDKPFHSIRSASHSENSTEGRNGREAIQLIRAIDRG